MRQSLISQSRGQPGALPPAPSSAVSASHHHCYLASDHSKAWRSAYCPLSSKTQTEGGYTLHLSRLGLHLSLTLSLCPLPVRSTKGRQGEHEVPRQPPRSRLLYRGSRVILSKDTVFPFETADQNRSPPPLNGTDAPPVCRGWGSQTTNRRINTEKTTNCDKCY